MQNEHRQAMMNNENEYCKALESKEANTTRKSIFSTRFTQKPKDGFPILWTCLNWKRSVLR